MIWKPKKRRVFAYQNYNPQTSYGKLFVTKIVSEVLRVTTYQRFRNAQLRQSSIQMYSISLKFEFNLDVPLRYYETSC